MPISAAARIRPLARRGSYFRRYGVAVLAVVVALGLRLTLIPLLAGTAPFLVFVLAVLWASWYGGAGPGMLATGLSALAGAYFFLPPSFVFGPLSTSNLVQLAIFLAIGATISSLNTRLRSAYLRESVGLEALSESEERFRVLVEGVQDHALFMLDAEGKVVLWNPGAQRIKGYEPQEVIGHHVSMFYPPEERAEADRLLREAVARGTVHREGWRVRKDGSRFWAHVVLTALRDPDGQLRGFAKITRDVSERKQAEDEIRLLNETLEERVVHRTAQLEEANRALQAFGYTVSHDLRAPLRAIQGFAEALVEDYGDQLEETAREYADRIVAASGRMERLIQDLLAYSRLSKEEVVLLPVDLEGVVDEAIAGLLDGVRERGGQISVERPLPPVLAHRPTLVQVLSNLLTNAVTFVAPGVAPRVRIRAESKAGRLCLWVEDNGIGIAPEHQQRVFDVFERLHGIEEYPGTGIGLAIVRKGVERMSGRAGVQSIPGAGSRFWIELRRPEAKP